MLTLDRLLAKGWLKGSAWAAVADFYIDGSRLGAEPYRLASASRHETRFEQKQSETFLAAHALAQLGYRSVALQSRESPDFCATFVPVESPRVAFGIEVAEIVDAESARWRNAIENVRVGVRDALDADSSLKAAVGDRCVNVTLWRCPSRSAERHLQREITELLRSAAIADQQGRRVVDMRFPALVEHWAHLYVSASRVGRVDVTAAAHAFDSRSLVHVALKVLERKRKKARAYDTSAPLWLVLSMTDRRGVFDESLEVLERLSVSIEPYERFIVCNEGRAIALNADGLRRTG